jgi:putative endonuclease
MAAHNDLGITGEQIAANYLHSIGKEVLAINYRYRRAEIDIIFKDGQLTVFCEVKTRTNERFGMPEEAVTDRKVELFHQAAEEYMHQNQRKGEIRFDILSILIKSGKQEIFHIKDAFY